MTITMGPVDRVVRAVAASGLGGESSGPQSLSPTRNEWQQAQSRLVAERLTGMAALLHRRGVLRLDDESTAELVALDAHWSQHIFFVPGHVGEAPYLTAPTVPCRANPTQRECPGRGQMRAPRR